MKEILNTIIYTLNYKQYRDENIFYFKINSNSFLIPNMEGFTDLNGIENLKLGKRNELKLNYSLLSLEDLELFRRMPYDKAFDMISFSKIDIFNCLNDENYKLCLIKNESHNILSYDKKIIYPKFISLSNPLYLLNDRDFNLEEIQNIIAKDDRFYSLFKKNIYEKELFNVNNIIISNIPYYNADDRTRYINVGFIPTNENWSELLTIIKDNDIKIKDNGYISSLSEILLESGILGFERKNKYFLKRKKNSIHKKGLLTEKIISFAKTIIDENHNILNPKTYLKHRIEDIEFEDKLKDLICTDKVDFVLFSSRSGAEEHVDTHLKHLDIYTYIIPVILPNKPVILSADKEYKLNIGLPIKINHQLPHSLKVESDEPLVLVMASKII